MGHTLSTMVAAGGCDSLKLTPLVEEIVSVAEEQHEECDDLEHDINDMESELVELYNDIEQDKLDCEHYEGLLAEKEIEMEKRIEEVKVMVIDNDERECDAEAREDEIEHREAVFFGGILAEGHKEHTGKMDGVHSGIKEIDADGEIDISLIAEIQTQHKSIMCKKTWLQNEIKHAETKPEMNKVEDACKEHKKKLKKKDAKVRAAMDELKKVQEAYAKLGGDQDVSGIWCNLELSDVEDDSCDEEPPKRKNTKSQKAANGSPAKN